MFDMPSILIMNVTQPNLKIVNNIIQNTIWNIKNFSLNDVFQLFQGESIKSKQKSNDMK